MSDPLQKTDLAGVPRTRRYEVREGIGEGAIGIVFRAHDRETGLEVAVLRQNSFYLRSLGFLRFELRAPGGRRRRAHQPRAGPRTWCGSSRRVVPFAFGLG